MVNDFLSFSTQTHMVCIYSHNQVRAFYGQKEENHYGTFLSIDDFSCNYGTPVLVYDWAKYSKDFMDAHKAFTRSVYNNFSDLKLGKLESLRKLVADGVDWVPKTAFTTDPDWGGVQFPAICKAANSYDSKGVEKIDKKRDVPDYIDIVQEIIPIDREFRIIAFRGKSNDQVQVLQVLEKKPKNDKAKDLRVDENLSREEMRNRPNTKFSWTMLSPADEGELLSKSAEIIKYIFKDNQGLNFAGFDIAMDKDGKAWYIEHNILPAPIGPTFLLLYKAIFEDWYHRDLEDKMIAHLAELAPMYCEGTDVDLTWTDPMPQPAKLQ